jgi:hypothetical protein
MKTQADVLQKAKLRWTRCWRRKHDLDAQLAVLKFQLEERKAQHEMTMKEHERDRHTGSPGHSCGSRTPRPR